MSLPSPVGNVGVCAVCHNEPQTVYWPKGLGRSCTAALLDAQEAASRYLLGHYPMLGTRIVSQLYQLLPHDWASDRDREAGPWVVAEVQRLTDQRLLSLRNFGPRSLARVRAVMPHLLVELDQAPTHADVGLMLDLGLVVGALKEIADHDAGWDPAERAAEVLALLTAHRLARQARKETGVPTSVRLEVS